VPLSSTLSAADCDQLITAVRRVAAAVIMPAPPTPQLLARTAPAGGHD